MHYLRNKIFSLDSYYSIDHYEPKQKTNPKKDNDRLLEKYF